MLSDDFGVAKNSSFEASLELLRLGAGGLLRMLEVALKVKLTG